MTNEVDMNVDADEDGGLGEFKPEKSAPSIWSLDAAAEEENTEVDEEKDVSKSSSSEEKDADEDELEKPSFLRRFKRNKNEKSQDKTD